MLGGARATVMAGGHTHIQMLRQHRGTLVVNPGSVGAPFKEFVDHALPTIMPYAEYATVEAEGNGVQVTLRRVPVDKHAMREAARACSNPLGPMSAALHCRASTAADTDWPQIAELYALLERFRRTPAVRVNRAFAVARAVGPSVGLALLDEQPLDYPYVHLVRGALLEELGRDADAMSSFEHAVDSARNEPEERQIRAHIERIRQKGTV